MAVIESIPEKNQTPSAQKGVLDYCMQPSKTLDEDEQLAYISGYNCVPELANESFLATQKIYGHEPDGVRFYMKEPYLTDRTLSQKPCSAYRSITFTIPWAVYRS